MSKTGDDKIFPLYSMLVGMTSCLISGTIFGLMSLKTNEGLLLILGIPFGSFLMLRLLQKLNKDKLLSLIIRSVLGGFVGFLLGFMLGELVAVITGFLFPTLKDLEQVRAQILPNICVLIVADAIYGAFIGDLLYGKKSIKFFTLVCAFTSIPFGALLSVPYDLSWVGFDQNMLVILISFGTTTGLAIGLYDTIKQKNLN